MIAKFRQCEICDRLKVHIDDDMMCVDCRRDFTAQCVDVPDPVEQVLNHHWNIWPLSRLTSRGLSPKSNGYGVMSSSTARVNERGNTTPLCYVLLCKASTTRRGWRRGLRSSRKSNGSKHSPRHAETLAWCLVLGGGNDG